MFVFFFYFFIQYLIQLFDTDNGGTFENCVSFASCLAFCGLGIQVVDQVWSLAGLPMLREAMLNFFFIKTKTIDTTPVLWASLAVN